MTKKGKVGQKQNVKRCSSPRPILTGQDTEFGNLIYGVEKPGGTCYEASRIVHAHMEGKTRPTFGGGQQVSSTGWSGFGQQELLLSDALDSNSSTVSSCYSGWGQKGTQNQAGFNSQDWGRKFLPSNGGCLYIDLNHVEACIPEVYSAFDHVAAWNAMVIKVSEATERANAWLQEMRPGENYRILVLANNSDGRGNSYGSHLSFSIPRSTWSNIIHRKLYHYAYFLSYLVSSIVFSGGGKVGTDVQSEPADYQISQRADFFENAFPSPQTTFNRPIVNSRDEALCGPSGWRWEETLDKKLARLHVIFFDTNLCQVASLLKVGATQLMLAMIERDDIPLDLQLMDPLATVKAWSRDPNLQAKARLTSGKQLTAVEMQQAILERATSFVAAGKADGIVPRAEEILSLWQETVEQLARFDVASLAGKLDWVLKRCICEREMATHNLSWETNRIQACDWLYHSLDRTRGLFWEQERNGTVQRVVSHSEIERFVHEPPDDTRAWLRAQVLRKLDPDLIESVDWDCIRFRTRRRSPFGWTVYDSFELPMHNPLGFTRARCERIFEKAGTLERALQWLGAREVSKQGQTVYTGEIQSSSGGEHTVHNPVINPTPVPEKKKQKDNDGDGSTLPHTTEQ